jgi:hypothetical protein
MNRLVVALSLPIGAAVLLQANPSQALTVVNVNGTDYDVEIFNGSLADLQASGLNLPWFGSISDATLFADAYAAIDSTTQSMSSVYGDVSVGPLFYTLSAPETFVAWNSGAAAPNYDNNPFTSSLICDTANEYDCTSSGLQWAYATLSPDARVPAPLPLLGATAAFSFSRKLRRRLSAQKFTF